MTPTAFLPIVHRSGSTPTVQFGGSSYSVDERAGTATITINLSSVAKDTVSVDYVTSGDTAQAGEDYVATGGTVHFAPGDTRETITVNVNNDRLYEGSETCRLLLSNPVHAVLGTHRTAVLTILDDEAPPTVRFLSHSSDASEGAGTATAIAYLSTVSGVTTTVEVATSDGTAQAGMDYVAVSGTLSFAPGETNAIAIVPVNEDSFDEPHETFRLTLSHPTNATLGTPETTTVTILDNDGPPTVQFSSNSYNAPEEVGAATVVATLSAAAEGTVTVNYATFDGTAKAGEDYVAANGTLSFAPGETNAMVTITVNEDAVDEPSETFSVVLSNPTHAGLGTPDRTTVTITDDDEPPTVRLSSDSYTIHESVGQATIIATLSEVLGQTVTVQYGTSDGTAKADKDYVAASGTLSFAPGETSATATVTITEDLFDEPNETFRLTLSNPSNSVLGTPGTATITIVDNDGPPTVQFSSSSYSAQEEAGVATAVATLSAAAEQAVTVDYATSAGSAEAGEDYGRQRHAELCTR